MNWTSFFVLLLIDGLAALLLTRNKSMSFGWGLFFCCCYSLVIGVPLILTSGKYGYSNKAKNRGTLYQKIKITLCLLLGILIIVGCILNPDNPQIAYPISFSIGFLGNAAYLILPVDTYVHEPIETTA